MNNILEVSRRVEVDTTIASYEYHTHQPLNTNYGANDEIRIILQEDLCTLPSESYIYLEGMARNAAGAVSTTTKLCNNAMAFLFSEARYELNGMVIDSVLQPGITSTLKGYLSLTPSERSKYRNAGWRQPNDTDLIDAAGNFNACLPLKLLFGFCEDFRKVLLNIRQELVLIRANSDVNAVVGTEELKITINKIYWKIPHVTPGLGEELALTKYIGKNTDTQLAFRNWQLHTYPVLNPTQRHTWSVTTMNKLSSPRYVILAFQTGREGSVRKDMTEFDHCNFSNIRVFLNNQRFPYDLINADFAANRYAILYDMYCRFQKSYYGHESEPLLTLTHYKEIGPLIVIDTSKQREHLMPSTVTLRLEFDTTVNMPASTSAFCLVLHDRIFTYNALTKMVKQI